MRLPQGPHRRYDPLSDQWVLVSAGRTRRPWLGHKERRLTSAERPAYDPDCYLCPGNVRANGERNPDYTSTFVFTNDFAALRPDIPDEAVDDGLLVARSAPGTCRVVCFAPRHDLTLTHMPLPGVSEVIDLWADQTDGARRHEPLGADLREPRRGHGRLQPAPTRADLGWHARCPTGLPARRAHSDATSSRSDDPCSWTSWHRSLVALARSTRMRNG